MGFNTQPPEGDWIWRVPTHSRICGFNTQPPEGDWVLEAVDILFLLVSTHSRLKATGMRANVVGGFRQVSTHSRLKATGERLLINTYAYRVSTHSRLKATGSSFR